DFQIVSTGSRLVIALSGANSLFGVLAQLNVYVVLRALMEPEEYMTGMDRLSDAAEALVGDARTKKTLARLNPDPQATDRFPSAQRVASFCKGNLTFTALSTA